MIKACIVTSSFYGRNRLFDLKDPVSNRDNCLHSMAALRDELHCRGIDLQTHDMIPLEQAEVVVFSDMPAEIPERRAGQKFILLAIESLAVLPRNFSTELYRHFDRVFTWHDELVDESKVVKINYAFDLQVGPHPSFAERPDFMCAIANNKRSDDPNELYTKRREIITWYERTHPGDLNLYGAGWDYIGGGALVARILRKVRLGKLLRSRQYDKTWRGIAHQKTPILLRHRFNLCFENIRDVPGYITEKIFDCFFTGCVPVYLGAGNVSAHIPRGCFIDFRDFDSCEDLHLFLKGIDSRKYAEHQEEAAAFLRSALGQKFSSAHFARTVADQISVICR